jgi:hypothetical protein
MFRAAIILAALMFLLGAGSARGQEEDNWRPTDSLKWIRPPERIGDRSNAAVEYFRIWDMLSSRDDTELREVMWGPDGADKVDCADKVDKNVRRLCEQHRDYIDALIRNGNAGECVWGVDREAGLMATLPHLWFLRFSALTIRMDAFRCMKDGSNAAAAERVASIIRMADQTRTDEILISSEVGAAICSLGLSTANTMIKEHRVTPATARLMLAALKSVLRDDLFGAAPAIQGERRVCVEWVRQHYEGERSGMRFMRELEWTSSGRGDPLNKFIIGMNEQQLSADLDRFDRYFVVAAAAWRRPDNAVQLSELSTEVWEGQYGLVARMMAPSMDRAARAINKVRQDLERTRRELEAIVNTNEAPAALPEQATK